MYVLMNPNSLMNGKHVHGTLITMEDAYVSNPPSQKAPQDVKKTDINRYPVQDFLFLALVI